jgi:hypothetical protein
MDIRRNRRGSTLLMAIMLIALLTIGLAAGFSRMSSERRIGADNQAQAKALSVAETGLERYIAAVSTMPGASFDTTITGMPGGNAFISLRRVRDSMGGLPALYAVRSRGVDTTARRYDPNAPTGQRIVAQYVTWRATTVNVPAGWTSITGLHKNGGSGTLSGTDACGVKPAVAGVAVPTTTTGGTPGYDQNGGGSVPSGTPPIAYIAPTTVQAANAVDIDWAGIVGGNVVQSHYMMNTTVSPTEGSWPTSTQMNAWPVIKVTGDLSLPGTGKGTLIVTGNLTISGAKQWDGIILVGGTLTSNGNNTVYGAVVTGLNVKLGQAVGISDVGNGTKTYQYNSCDIANSQNQFAGLTRIPNGWADNWPSF